MVLPNKQGRTQVLEVWGEPEPNVTENLIAFVSCADDGCDNKILVADIIWDVVLEGHLPVSTQQTYLSLKWAASGRKSSVEGESFGGQPPPSFYLHSCRKSGLRHWWDLTIVGRDRGRLLVARRERGRVCTLAVLDCALLCGPSTSSLGEWPGCAVP